ncbi:MAG: adenylosuccinate synthase [Clostridiales Family XIII bacterium]|nr:adenylosuccinate synthase [Clostridiales Family XIII bacterium]
MNNKNIIIVGTQWGDEGKGKIIDFLARKADLVVRAQGGANAGHTVVINGKEYALHLIPSGILNTNAINIIGNGVAFDMESFLEEMESLEKNGVKTDKIFISDRVHLVFPYHKVLDALSEKKLLEEKIGTTKKGIGPCYMDKVARTGLRLIDVFDKDSFIKKLSKNIDDKNEIIEKIYNEKTLSKNEIIEKQLLLFEKIKDKVKDISLIIEDAVHAEKTILFEGAQATMLDIDLGTYPFVTSSHPISGGFSAGTGSSPLLAGEIIGIAKAYTTRVGEGPFVSELFNAVGNHIREKGKEYGTTTGRPRRVGWLDTVVLRHAARVNGLTGMSLMLLDVLDELDEIYICDAYEVDGEIIKNFPADINILKKAKPVLKKFNGWKKDISVIRSFDELPNEAKEYIYFIENITNIPIKIVSIGPDRKQTLIREKII